MNILYVISCIYHGLSKRTRAKGVLRVIDHCNVYLLATVVAVLLLYLLVTRFRWNVKGIISVAVLLYLIGVCHNTYRHVFDNVLPAASEIKWYLSVFATARNGIFFGFPFVTMGYLFWAKSDHIRKMTYGMDG